MLQEKRKFKMTEILIILAIGLSAGIISGFVGIGGGAIVVPALVFLLGFAQHEAQGTTLAMLVPPIGILAVWKYFEEGHVNTKVAILLCAGFVLGAWLGAKWAVKLSAATLKKIFATILALIALKLFLSK